MLQSPFISLSLFLSLFLSISLSISLYFSLFLSISLSISLSIYLSIYLSLFIIFSMWVFKVLRVNTVLWPEVEGRFMKLEWNTRSLADALPQGLAEQNITHWLAAGCWGLAGPPQPCQHAIDASQPCSSRPQGQNLRKTSPCCLIELALCRTSSQFPAHRNTAVICLES